MTTFHLQPADARLVYLAAVYHLGRPGSETDAATLQRHALGLGPVRAALEPQLGAGAETSAVIAIELSPYQLTRLGAALHGTVNELKQYGMAEGRSAVPGFAEAFVRLFPDGAAAGDGDASAALDLVPEAVMLRRRLDATLREAELQITAANGAQAGAVRASGPSRRARLRGRLSKLLGRRGR
jgi:hypothetical protein